MNDVPDLPSENDEPFEAVLRRLKDNPETAWAVIYERLSVRIVGMLRRRLKAPPRGTVSLSEALLSAFATMMDKGLDPSDVDKIHSWEDLSKHIYWLARTKFSKQCRRSGMAERPDVRQRIASREQERHRDLQEIQEASEFFAAVVDEFLSSIENEKHRQIVAIKLDNPSLTYEEIGARVGRTVETVSVVWRKARAKLRDMYRKFDQT